jgi:hypothetical protein
MRPGCDTIERLAARNGYEAAPQGRHAILRRSSAEILRRSAATILRRSPDHDPERLVEDEHDKKFSWHEPHGLVAEKKSMSVEERRSQSSRRRWRR